MTLAQIKKKMIAWRDFYDGDIPQTDVINNAKTKADLKQVFVEHEQLLERTLDDARQHLKQFKRSLGL